MDSIKSFFSNLTIAKQLLLFIAPILSVLLSMKQALLGLLILIIIDLITGIRRNQREEKISFNPHKLHFWKAIKSYLLRKTWRKAYEYGLGIIVVVIFETLILGSTNIEIMGGKVFTISELSVLVPSVIELWSIFENIESSTGNNFLKKLNLLLSGKFKILMSLGQSNKQLKVENNAINKEF